MPPVAHTRTSSSSNAGATAAAAAATTTASSSSAAVPPAPAATAAAKPFDFSINACRAIAAACADNPVASASHPLGKFSSAAVPGISLDRYAAHLAARMEHGEAGILLGLCLIMRVWRTHRAAPSPDTLHRLLLAATTVAMKAHFDDFYVNKYMARIGGLETARELGELEAHMFLTLLGGSATVRQKEIRATLDGGLVPLGKQLQRGVLDDLGAQRKINVLLAEDILPLTPFEGYVDEARISLAGSPVALPLYFRTTSNLNAGGSSTPADPGRPIDVAAAGTSSLSGFGDSSSFPVQLASFHDQFSTTPASPQASHPGGQQQGGGHNNPVAARESTTSFCCAGAAAPANAWPTARPDFSQSAIYVPAMSTTHGGANGSVPSGLWSGSVTAAGFATPAYVGGAPSRVPHSGFALTAPATAARPVSGDSMVSFAGSATCAIRAARSVAAQSSTATGNHHHHHHHLPQPPGPPPPATATSEEETGGSGRAPPRRVASFPPVPETHA